MDMKTSAFKSEEGRDRVRAFYNGVLSRFPFAQRTVGTAFGETFILVAGRESDPPVILLHGSCSNSAFWFPEIVALSNRFRVYAVDIIGEAGNSEEYRPDLDTEAFALWMREVADALGIEKTAVIGNSLGGWVALKFATAYPERVSRLILIASAGIAQVRPQFLSDVAQARRADGTVPVSAAIIGAPGLPKEVLDFMNLMAENYNPIQELPVFAEGQLRRLTMPVLFIDGQEDAIIDGQASAQRLSCLVPAAQIRLLPHCGHVVMNSPGHLLAFLADTQPA
jgi:pimeloyl-ACP methyl ester carboxylesterase